MSRQASPHAGFTLIEMIAVIVLIGILAGIVSSFIRNPITSYMDGVLNASLGEMANTAIRGLGRDLRTAVPNSIRMAAPSSSTYLEFLPTRAGGVYRALPAGSGTPQCSGTLAQDILDFTTADSCFAVIGPALSMIASPADSITVGSIQSGAAPAYNNTATGVLRTYTGATGSVTAINFTATQLPVWAQLQSQRFQVIPGDQQAVTYACVPSSSLGALDTSGNGQAKLVRYWAYGFNAAQVAPPLATGQSAVLVDKVSGCNIVYNANNQNVGLVTVTLQLTVNNVTVRLYDEIHVNNQP